MSQPDETCQLADDVLLGTGLKSRALERAPGETGPPNLGRYLEETLFMDVVNSLPIGKAAGPDGSPNDIIKKMPKEFLSLLFRIIQKSWVGHHTPIPWKNSVVALLHKKGDPTRLKNWRPIALANCTYKLWTAVVTRLLTDDTEFRKVLHGSQEGFRRQRNTLNQLSTMMLTIEDAHLSGQELHIMYIDFANAFGSPDHGRLLEVLRHEGYPSDVIEVVRDLYPGGGHDEKSNDGHNKDCVRKDGELPCSQGNHPGRLPQPATLQHLSQSFVTLAQQWGQRVQDSHLGNKNCLPCVCGRYGTSHG